MFLDEGIDVVSLFDGMSCGRIALARSGIGVKNYYASEIDKYAMLVSKANWPRTQHMGDVTKWREWPIDWSRVKLILAGSPCQGFSSAGKQGGTKAVLDGIEYVVADRETYISLRDQGAEFLSQSYLFWEFVLCLDHAMSCNPDVKFLLENVKMSKNNLNMISGALGVEPIHIDSSICSPCSRPRNYWASWEFGKPELVDCDYMDFVEDFVMMSDAWGQWWNRNRDYQEKKSFSKIVDVGDKGVTMVVRQYACWAGNFITTFAGIAKPGKRTLAKLVGAPVTYFDVTTQRQAEILTGNGWTVDVIKHILDSSGLHS